MEVGEKERIPDTEFQKYWLQLPLLSKKQTLQPSTLHHEGAHIYILIIIRVVLLGNRQLLYDSFFFPPPVNSIAKRSPTEAEDLINLGSSWFF